MSPPRKTKKRTTEIQCSRRSPPTTPATTLLDEGGAPTPALGCSSDSSPEYDCVYDVELPDQHDEYDSDEEEEPPRSQAKSINYRQTTIHDYFERQGSRRQQSIAQRQAAASPSTQPARPPPASQSYFVKFENFEADEKAPFEHEFARLASSQEWKPGSQEYVRNRTIAICEELQTHYFSQPSVPTTKEELDEDDDDDEIREITAAKLQSLPQLTEEEIRRQGYQALCREVGIEPAYSITRCKRMLKATLVNIVDLIDARRNGKKIKIWSNFDEFRMYTSMPKHRISKEDAKGTVLAALLQNLSRSSNYMRSSEYTARDSLARVRTGRVVRSRHQ